MPPALLLCLASHRVQKHNQPHQQMLFAARSLQITATDRESRGSQPPTACVADAAQAVSWLASRRLLVASPDSSIRHSGTPGTPQVTSPPSVDYKPSGLADNSPAHPGRPCSPVA